MADPDSNRGRPDLVVLLLLLALALFASPLTGWWATAALPWYGPFLLWGLLIAAIALHDALQGRDDA